MKKAPLYPKLCYFLINRTAYLPYVLKSVILYLLPRKIYSVKISDNLKISVDAREVIGNYIYFNRSYEPTLTRWFLRFIREGSFVIDAGAHIGYYTFLAANIVGDRGRVISFEPYYRNYNLLKKTIQENDFKNVILETSALSDKKAEKAMYFPYSYNLGTGSFFNDKHIFHTSSYLKKRLLINTISLDDYLLEKDTRSIDLIKIDAEGAELPILTGMRQGLKDNIYKTIIFDLHLENNPDKSYALKIKQIFKTFQYKLYHIMDEDTLVQDKGGFTSGYCIASVKELN